jgi:tRNA(Ile)-lysidine synthase
MTPPLQTPFPAWVQQVQTALQARFRREQPARVWLAFSGGVDSTVLLHLAQVAQLPLTALHVNHGWHPEAAAWARHCQSYASALEVPCLVYQLEKSAVGNSPEQQARHGRYRWFQSLMQPGDWLLLAHHADDVVTGFLLQMLKNQDPCSLMPEGRPFAAGRLWRPLLRVAKADLYALAQAQGFSWLEDPSNHDPRYPRNFLRQHWQQWQNYFPGAPSAVAGFIAKQRLYCQAAKKRHRRQLFRLKALLTQKNVLPLPQSRWPLAAFLVLSAFDRWQVMRRACRELGLPPPPQGQWQGFQPNLFLGKGSLHWPGGSLYLYRKNLYLCLALPSPPLAHWQALLDQPQALDLPVVTAQGQVWQLTWRQANTDEKGLPLTLFAAGITVGFRQEGARIKTGQGHSALKNYLQQHAIPPWQRPYLPMLYQNNSVIAVLGVGLADGIGVASAGVLPTWQVAPWPEKSY